MSTQFLTPGQPAPNVVLTAVVTRRKVDFALRKGVPLLLLFVTQQMRGEAPAVLEGVRRVYPAHQQLQIANVLDLHMVPRMLRGMAEGVIGNAYKDAITAIPDEFEPEDHLILLPDWDGKVHKAFQVPDPDAHMPMALIDGKGTVRATYHGPNPLDNVLEMLAPLMES